MGRRCAVPFFYWFLLLLGGVRSSAGFGARALRARLWRDSLFPAPLGAVRRVCRRWFLLLVWAPRLIPPPSFRAPRRALLVCALLFFLCRFAPVSVAVLPPCGLSPAFLILCVNLQGVSLINSVSINKTEETATESLLFCCALRALFYKPDTAACSGHRRLAALKNNSATIN